jgi:crossover junction endodeoxyribonuclease RusA
VIHFYAPGKAQTKGSGRAVGRGRFTVVVNDNPKEKGWAETVAWCARSAMNELRVFAPIAGPVALTLTFEVARPKDHFGKAGNLLDNRKALRPTKKPDLDKMLRSVGDALTGICFRDDSQVVRITAVKRYSADGSAGVHVSVNAIEEVAS